MNPMKRVRHAFRNVSGEDIPPYALVRVADGNDVLLQHILDGHKADANDNSIYVANGPKTIADDRIGHGYWTTEPCVVAYDPAWVEPGVGQEWGPKDGSWYLDEDGEGFIILSVDSDKGVCRIGKKDRVTETVIQAAAQTCGCGTQQVHGEQLISLGNVDVEFAKTYSVVTPGSSFGSEFPELTYAGTTSDGEHVWKSPTVSLVNCYHGTRDSQLWFIAHEPSSDPGDYYGGNITLPGTLKLVSIASSCTGTDASLQAITGAWEPINNTFNPLNGTEFRLNDFMHTGRDYPLPCIVCLHALYNRVLLKSPVCETDSLGGLSISGPASITARVNPSLSAVGRAVDAGIFSQFQILSGATKDLSGPLNQVVQSLSGTVSPGVEGSAGIFYSVSRSASVIVPWTVRVRYFYASQWWEQDRDLNLLVGASVSVGGSFGYSNYCTSPSGVSWAANAICGAGVEGTQCVCGVNWGGSDVVPRPPGTYTVPAPDASNTNTCATTSITFHNGPVDFIVDIGGSITVTLI